MEQLILELYSPKTLPDRISEVQKDIQRLQHKHSGWQLGLDLLRNEQSASIRFYGALTLTIKINADWSDIADNDELKTSLLQNLIENYIRLTTSSEAAFVLQKLCSTLVAYFLKISSGWDYPVRQILASLLQGNYVPFANVPEFTQILPALENVTYVQLRSALWFSLALAEDVTRAETGGPAGILLTTALLQNEYDVWRLVYICLFNLSSRGKPHEQDLGELQIKIPLVQHELYEAAGIALQIVPAWLIYSQPSGNQGKISVDDLIGYCLDLVAESCMQPELTEKGLQTLSTVSQPAYQHSKKSQQVIRDKILSSSVAESCTAALLQGDFSQEGLQFVELLSSSVCLKDLTTPKYLGEPNIANALELLARLMQCPGAAAVQDPVCQIVLDCFNEVVEGLLEWPKDSAEETPMKALIRRVCESCVLKAKFPQEEMETASQTWDADDREKFQSFRHDVEDLLISAFNRLSFEIIEMVVQPLLQVQEQINWELYEASLFCLCIFSETLSNDPNPPDDILASIFRSRIWNAILGDAVSCPVRVRQAVINFLSRSTESLQKNSNVLEASLNFLFSSLHLPDSSGSASRAINTLCQAERIHLVAAVPQFIGALTTISDLDIKDKNRIYTAVAAVVQAQKTETEKLECLSQILVLVMQDQMTLQRLLSAGDEEATVKAQEVLQILGSIGKGLRAPTESIISLEEEASPEAGFWTSGHGKPFQDQALSICTSIISIPAMQLNAEVVEAACEFMKSGYTEEDPSPFRFSTESSTGLLTSLIKPDSPAISPVLATASTFLASTTPETLPETQFLSLLGSVLVLQQRFSQPTATGNSTSPHDDDFLHASLDFVERLLPKWSAKWFSLPNAQGSLSVAVEFALSALSNADTLPRRAAASFFATLFEISTPITHATAVVAAGATGGAAAIVPSSSAVLVSTLQALSPRIVGLLVHLIAGECARSEIDSICEPLRAVVKRQGLLAREIFRQAVRDDAGVLSPKALRAVDFQGRMRFVGQVEGLRGARKTNEVCREFWLKCRGKGFGYTA